jgi:hypothetical protein
MALWETVILSRTISEQRKLGYGNMEIQGFDIGEVYD